MSTDNKQNIRLKEVRLYFGLNQSDFSKSMDIDQAYLSQLENGKVRIGSKILLKLSQKYKVSIDWFFSGDGTMFKQNEMEAIKIYNELEKMVMDVKNRRLNTI